MATLTFSQIKDNYIILSSTPNKYNLIEVMHRITRKKGFVNLI